MPPDRLKLPAENLADPEALRRAGKVESRTVIPHGDDQLPAFRPSRYHDLSAGSVLLGIGQRGIQRTLQLLQYGPPPARHRCQHLPRFAPAGWGAV